MKTYPIALVHLEQRRCVVVGGGKIATRKVEGLLEAGGNVVVISPEVSPELDAIIRQKEVEWWPRKYAPGDLARAFLAIAATDDPEVNAQIWDEATDSSILINVVDDPEHCNFIAPAIVRRGEMTIAISSGGNAPALSRHLRQQLEKQFGPEYETYIRLLSQMRKNALEQIPKENQREFWEELVKSEIVERIKAGKDEEARSMAERILLNYSKKGYG